MKEQDITENLNHRQTSAAMLLHKFHSTYNTLHPQRHHMTMNGLWLSSYI